MNKRRVCCMMLALAMVLCMGRGVTVSAAQMEGAPEMMGLPEGQEVQIILENGMPRYSYTSSITSQVLFIDGVAYIAGTAIGYESITTHIYGYLYLQKKSGSGWINVETWNKSEADSALHIAESATGLSAGTYRARFVAYVYSGSNYEVVTFESDSVIYNP